MATTLALSSTVLESCADEEIVFRILAGEIDLFASIMRRYNTRLYRVALSILRDPGEAEDVMEDAYVRAYQHLNQFAGRAKFSTWLTRIAVNEALMRRRRRAQFQSLDNDSEISSGNEPVSAAPNPEQMLFQKELARSLENVILSLPENYRLVLVLRELQELSVAETAECLGISEENVKIRLYRARAALRRELDTSADEVADTIRFPARRCDLLVASVLARLRLLTLVPSVRV